MAKYTRRKIENRRKELSRRRGSRKLLPSNLAADFSKNLTIEINSGQDGLVKKSVLKEEFKPEGPVKEAGEITAKLIDRPDAGEIVSELVQEHILPFIEIDVDILKKALKEAQINSPKNKKRFIDEVNALLDTYHLRIQVNNNELCRLVFKPGASNRGYIMFSGGRTRNHGGFETADLDVVPVRHNYVGNNRPAIAPQTP